MSERGAFTSEYLYCGTCASGLRDVLAKCSDIRLHIPPAGRHEGRPLPIVSGFVGGMYAGEELHRFDLLERPAIETAICHPVKIAVIPEGSEAEIIEFKPREEPER